MLYDMLCFTLAPGSDSILPKLENIPQYNDTCIDIYEHKHGEALQFSTTG